MAFYHKWDVKNGFFYVLTFFSLISDGLGSVQGYEKLLYYFGPIVASYRRDDAVACLLVATNRPSWPAIPRHLKQMFEIKPSTTN